MKKVLICLGVWALLFSFLGAANANLIVNGDFETVDNRTGIVRGFALDSLGPGQSWDVYNALPGGWYTGPNDAGIEVQRDTVVTAHSGDHYIELDSHSRDPGALTNSSMSQDIDFLTDFVYYLSFYYHPRPDNPFDDSNGIEVYFDDPAMSGAPLVTADGPVSQTDWMLYSVNLGFVEAGQYNLKFVAVGADDRFGGFLDDIEVNPVPEPATMLLLGTGLVGLAGFRRKFKK